MEVSCSSEKAHHGTQHGEGMGWGTEDLLPSRPNTGCFCSIIPFVQKVIHGVVIRWHLGQLVTVPRLSGLQCPRL